MNCGVLRSENVLHTHRAWKPRYQMGSCGVRLLVRSYDNFQICHSNFGCRARCLRLPHIIWVTAIQITMCIGVDALPTSTTTRWRQRRKSDKLIALNALCAANWNVKPNLQIIQMGFTLRFFFSLSLFSFVHFHSGKFYIYFQFNFSLYRSLTLSISDALVRCDVVRGSFCVSIYLT